MKNTERAKSNRMILKYALLLVYLATLSYLLFFAEGLGRTTEHWHTVNLIPFHEIRRYLSNIDSMGFFVVMVNILGNVVVFLPFGFLIPAMWPEDNKRHPLGIFLLSMVLSATFEILQALTNVGSADVDDCILNTLGGCLGYLVYMLWRRFRYGRIDIESDT